MKYIIGVDGGGTKTEAVAYSLNGEVLEKSLTGFGNLINGEQEALTNIITSIKNLTDKIGIDELEGLYLGIAGCESGDNKEKIKNKIRETLNKEAVVINDGELALKAMLKGEDGILTIAGTGSISFGIKDGKSAKAGGWGHLLGDEGSGYKISIEAIKNMLNEEDNSLEKSKLTLKIMEKLNIKTVDEVIGFVYPATKDEVAILAPVVSMLAEEGDSLSISILEAEAISLAKTTGNVYRKLSFDKCSIGLVGGVVRKSKVFRSKFEETLRNEINVIDFIEGQCSAAMGAYYMHK
ncbi:MAG: N-acetylglucosamine kinase [Sarcina sp.]